MQISNKQIATKYKRIFFIVSIVLAFLSLAFFLLDRTFFGLAGVGVFSLWYLYFHVADYQFIEYSDEDGKIALKYYKAVSFGSKSYHAIEFPQSILQNAHFENTIFGKFSDLTFIVRTKRGIAEYPSVSLSALLKNDRQRMKQRLDAMLQR